ncbi:hypothetical protein DPMN_114242 [Dreissena polymorpha]|uniref:Uncharacterized protein n=1 Tax=Dreissena polymorpha TaxID=45954 RepID=A0A9D4KJI8_DREPO|nr:hypothetical protein DPMN_114242 [Dreissena polymorpha]
MNYKKPFTLHSSTSTSYVGAITLDFYATGGARSRERYEMIDRIERIDRRDLIVKSIEIVKSFASFVFSSSTQTSPVTVAAAGTAMGITRGYLKLGT